MTTEPSPDPRDVIATLLRRRFDGIGWSAEEEGQTQLVWEVDPDGLGPEEPEGPTLRLAGHVNEVRLATPWREPTS